jgi:hypothetical protein
VEFRPVGVTVNAILPHAATRVDAMAKGLDTPLLYDPADTDTDTSTRSTSRTLSTTSPRHERPGSAARSSRSPEPRWGGGSRGPQRPRSTDGQWTDEALDTALATDVYGRLSGRRGITKK